MLKKDNLKLALLAISGLFIYYFFNAIYHFSIPCPIKTITGYYCPGCGITRLLFSLIKLDFYQAFRYNPLVFILIILTIIYFILKIFLKMIWKKDLIISQWIYYILIVILIFYGILRNIPGFEYLTPTTI